MKKHVEWRNQIMCSTEQRMRCFGCLVLWAGLVIALVVSTPLPVSGCGAGCGDCQGEVNATTVTTEPTDRCPGDLITVTTTTWHWVFDYCSNGVAICHQESTQTVDRHRCGADEANNCPPRRGRGSGTTNSDPTLPDCPPW